MLAEHEATQDQLLDALAHLNEERDRNSRLQRQLDVARALSGQPSSGTPALSSTTIAAA